jgi:hypothetical protein
MAATARNIVVPAYEAWPFSSRRVSRGAQDTRRCERTRCLAPEQLLDEKLHHEEWSKRPLRPKDGAGNGPDNRSLAEPASRAQLVEVTSDVYGHFGAKERKAEAELMEGVFGVSSYSPIKAFSCSSGSSRTSGVL